MQTRQRVARGAARAAVLCAFSGFAAFGPIGCASASSEFVSTDAYRQQTHDAHPSLATLTAAELETVPSATSAMDAVRQLRPLFLRPRPSTASFRGQPPTLAVYINGMYAGGAETLQQVPASTIATMKYLQRGEALTFASTLTPGDGFIMITLKRAP